MTIFSSVNRDEILSPDSFNWAETHPGRHDVMSNLIGDYVMDDVTCVDVICDGGISGKRLFRWPQSDKT
jgi:hypothetical protein